MICIEIKGKTEKEFREEGNKKEIREGRKELGSEKRKRGRERDMRIP